MAQPPRILRNLKFRGTDLKIRGTFRATKRLLLGIDQYRTPGPCPSQISLIFLNMAGTNILVDNDRFGIFKIDPEWKKGLRGLPNTLRTGLDWPGVKTVVEKYKIDEQRAFDLCQPQMSFQDLLPAVGSTLDTKPFTPLSPLWNF